MSVHTCEKGEGCHLNAPPFRLKRDRELEHGCGTKVASADGTLTIDIVFRANTEGKKETTTRCRFAVTEKGIRFWQAAPDDGEGTELRVVFDNRVRVCCDAIILRKGSGYYRWHSKNCTKVPTEGVSRRYVSSAELPHDLIEAEMSTTTSALPFDDQQQREVDHGHSNPPQPQGGQLSQQWPVPQQRTGGPQLEQRDCSIPQAGYEHSAVSMPHPYTGQRPRPSPMIYSEQQGHQPSPAPILFSTSIPYTDQQYYQQPSLSFASAQAYTPLALPATSQEIYHPYHQRGSAEGQYELLGVQVSRYGGHREQASPQPGAAVGGHHHYQPLYDPRNPCTKPSRH